MGILQYRCCLTVCLEIGGFARDTHWDSHACLDATHSPQASVEHFQQCAEFPLLRNRGLGPLAVTVLPIMALDLTITRTDGMSIDGHISKAVTARANILTGAVKLEL